MTPAESVALRALRDQIAKADITGDGSVYSTDPRAWSKTCTPPAIRSLLKAYDESCSQATALREAARAVLGTELGELACTGSHAPAEDALGRLRDALSQSDPAVVAESAEQRAVAWMDPETRDVIHTERKRDWQTQFGAGGRVQAASYTVPLYTAAPAAQQAAPGLPLVVTSAPQRIWLDLGELAHLIDPGTRFCDLADVTWSEDNATGNGIEYVRAGLQLRDGGERG